MGFPQRRVASHTDDHAVDIAVDRKIVVKLAVAMEAFHAGLQGSKALQVTIGCAFGGELGGKAFDPGEGLEQLGNARGLQIRDAGTAVWAQLDQAFSGKQLDGFAKWGP